jgi:hypothetical protein
MVHEVEVNISAQSELLMHNIGWVNLAAAGTTGGSRGEFAANLIALEFGKFLVPVGLEELVGVQGLDSLALEGVEMVRVEEFLCLFGLHCFIEVLGDFEDLLVVEGEGHAKKGLVINGLKTMYYWLS